MKSGVPFDVAFSLPEAQRTAFVIKFGELNGGTFNFNTMDWSKTK